MYIQSRENNERRSFLSVPTLVLDTFSFRNMSGLGYLITISLFLIKEFHTVEKRENQLKKYIDFLKNLTTDTNCLNISTDFVKPSTSLVVLIRTQ